MTDLITKVHETLGTMNPEERLAYSKGLSHAFTEVFTVFGQVFDTSADIHDVFQRLTDSWDYVGATQVVRGVL